jgi:dihydropyrimidinase
MLLHDGGVRAGRMSLHRFVEVTSTTPAKVFGLFPRKGTIAVGSDGDLVIFDPNKRVTLSHATLHQRVDYTPYEGREVIGAPETVLVRGTAVVQNGEWRGAKGSGRFLKRGSPRL